MIKDAPIYFQHHFGARSNTELPLRMSVLDLQAALAGEFGPLSAATGARTSAAGLSDSFEIVDDRIVSPLSDKLLRRACCAFEVQCCADELM